MMWVEGRVVYFRLVDQLFGVFRIVGTIPPHLSCFMSNQASLDETTKNLDWS